MHMLCMMVVGIFLDVFVKEIKDMKRPCVHVTPRASLCTTTENPVMGRCGAFALLGVRARKLGEFI